MKRAQRLLLNYAVWYEFIGKYIKIISVITACLVVDLTKFLYIKLKKDPIDIDSTLDIDFWNQSRGWKFAVESLHSIDE